MKKLLNFLFWLLFLSEPSSSYAENVTMPEFTENTLISVIVEKIDFISAQLKVEFYLAESPDETTKICVSLTPRDCIRIGHQLKLGKNIIHAPIFRPPNFPRAHGTTNIYISVYSSKNPMIYSATLKHNIYWPGQKYAETFAGKPIKTLNDKSLERVIIYFDSYDKKIFHDLLLTGISIDKFDVNSFNYKNEEQFYFEGIYPIVGSKVSLATAKEIILAISNTGGKKALILPKGYSSNGENNVIIQHWYNKSMFPDITEDRWIKLSPELIQSLKETNDPNKLGELLNINKSDKFQSKILERQYITARDYIDDEKYQEAKIVLDEMLEADPKFHKTYIQYARLNLGYYAHDDNYTAAEKSLITAKTLNNRDPDIFILMGHIYNLQGRYDKALEEFSLAESIGSDNLWLYANWGYTYLKLRDIENSSSKYFKVYQSLSVTPQNLRVKRLNIDNATKVFIHFDMANQAIPLFQALNSLDTKEYCLPENLSELQLHDGQFNAALKTLKDPKMKRCPSETSILESHIHFGLVSYYLENNNPNKANDHFLISQAKSRDAGESLFEFAKSEKLTHSLKILLKENYFNLNHQIYGKFTPLIYAIEARYPDIAENLLRLGADPNLPSQEQGLRPIEYALMYGNPEVFKLLMQYNAKTDFTLANGMTFYEYVINNDYKHFIPLLEKNTML